MTGIVFQALEGGDLGAVARHGVGDAGARGRAVDQHGAGAAHAVLAADVGAGEELVLAQEIGEVQSRLDIRPHLAPLMARATAVTMHTLVVRPA